MHFVLFFKSGLPHSVQKEAPPIICNMTLSLFLSFFVELKQNKEMGKFQGLAWGEGVKIPRMKQTDCIMKVLFGKTLSNVCCGTEDF